jgi:hypothetical protein
MSLSNDARPTDRRSSYMMVNPAVALAMVLRSRPSTPAIEEARRLSLDRQREGSSSAVIRSLHADRPWSESPTERAEAMSGRSGAPRRGPGRERTGSVTALNSTDRAGRRHGAVPTAPVAPSAPGALPERRTVASANGTGRVPAASRAPSAPGPQTHPSPRRLVVTGGTSAGFGSVARDGSLGTSTSASVRRPSSAVGTGRSVGASALALAPVGDVLDDHRHVETTLRRARLSSVPKPAANRPTAAVTGTVSGLVLLAIAFTSVGLHAKLAKNQIVLDKLRTDISVEERSNQRWRVDVAELQAPQRIVAEAEKMGMAPSRDVVFLDSAALAVSSAVTIPPAATFDQGN